MSAKYDIILKVNLNNQIKTLRASDIFNRIPSLATRDELMRQLDVRDACSRFVKKYKSELQNAGASLVDYRIVQYELAQRTFAKETTGLEQDWFKKIQEEQDEQELESDTSESEQGDNQIDNPEIQ